MEDFNVDSISSDDIIGSTFGVTDTLYRDSNLDDNMYYCYAVSGINSENAESPLSQVMCEITENQLPKPEDVYGLTHLLSENICNYYNKTTNINCINIRLSNSFGAPVFHENNCWWLAVNDMIKMAFNNKQINLLSDGTPLRDFIHIEDICNSIEVIINSDMTKHHNTMNIASGRTFTIFEFALKIKNVYKKELKLIVFNA